MTDGQDVPNGDKAAEDLSNSILYEVIEDHICKITLNRPERRNAIAVPDMNELLANYLERAQDDDRIKEHIRTDGDLDSLRDDPRFTALTG